MIKEIIDITDPEIIKLIEMSYDELVEKFSKGEINRREFDIGFSIARLLHASSQHKSIPKMGHVYVIENENGLIKCGRSINPEKRIRTLVTQGNIQIKRNFISERHTSFYKTEVEFHRYYKEKRLIGEWFNTSFEKAVSWLQDFLCNKK